MTANPRLNEEIRDYFDKPGFARFLQQLQKLHEASSSGARGYVSLEKITEAERQALDGFYGTYSPPILQETKRYPIKKFERLLEGSRFSLTLAKLLEIMSGENVRTRQETRAMVEVEWGQFIQQVVTSLDEPLIQTKCAGILAWTNGLLNETSPGSRTLRKLFTASREEAALALSYGLQALIALKRGDVPLPIRLPILAARITGDSHALDWKYPLGRLFWWGLTAIHQEQTALPEEEAVMDDITTTQNLSQAILLREGYRRGGIADDDLSSQVMLFAPELFGVWEERIVTLRQVERIAEKHNKSLSAVRVYVVENPSIFAELVEAALAQRRCLDADRMDDVAAAAPSLAPVIICGNGQPTVAVIRMLDWLCWTSAGVILQYAGDLDSKGLSIAQGLQMRYPKSFQAWRMDKDQVLRYAHQGLPLSEVEKNRFRNSEFIWDHELGLVIAEKGVKLHQELWASELVSDFLQTTWAR